MSHSRETRLRIAARKVIDLYKYMILSPIAPPDGRERFEEALELLEKIVERDTPIEEREFIRLIRKTLEEYDRATEEARRRETARALLAYFQTAGPEKFRYYYGEPGPLLEVCRDILKEEE